MNFHNIKFKPSNIKGFDSKTHFDNGLTLSVVCGSFTYCTPREDLSSVNQYLSFEIGVWDENEDWVTKQFFNGITDDVVGWQSRDDINDLMTRISNYNNTTIS